MAEDKIMRQLYSELPELEKKYEAEKSEKARIIKAENDWFYKMPHKTGRNRR